MAEKTQKLPPDVSPPAGGANDRRQSDARREPAPPDAKSLGTVGHDDLGNAVWEWRVDVPARREDDPTLDLLECLDVDGMSLEEEDDAETKTESFNPYNKKS
jgi:hypothetical protein